MFTSYKLQIIVNFPRKENVLCILYSSEILLLLFTLILPIKYINSSFSHAVNSQTPFLLGCFRFLCCLMVDASFLYIFKNAIVSLPETLLLNCIQNGFNFYWDEIFLSVNPKQNGFLFSFIWFSPWLEEPNSKISFFPVMFIT